MQLRRDDRIDVVRTTRIVAHCHAISVVAPVKARAASTEFPAARPASACRAPRNLRRTAKLLGHSQNR